MKTKQDFWFRFKVIAGYLCLASFAACVVWFFYSKVVAIMSSSDYETELLVEKANLMGNTMSLLYENESSGNNYIQSPAEDHYIQYQNSLSQVRLLLDSLSHHQLSGLDPGVLFKLDSLLLSREANIKDIVAIQEQLGLLAQSYSSSVAQAIPSNLQIRPAKDTSKLPRVSAKIPLPPRTRLREEEIFDTIRPVVRSERKTNLWGRLRQAITGEEEVREVMEVRRTKRMVTDTLVSLSPPPPPDTLNEAYLAKAARDTVLRAVQQVINRDARRREQSRQALNRRLDTLVATGQQINKQINRSMESLQTQWFSGTVRTIEEKRGNLEETRQAIFLAVGVIFVVILLFCILIIADINKSIRVRHNLEESRNKAEELTASRERLLLTISHDIKVPLSSLIGYIDLLKHPGPKGNKAHLEEYLESMTYSAEHIMELLGNLLEYYRLESGKTKLHLSATPLSLLFEEATSVFSPIASKKGVLLNTDIAIARELCVQTDSLHLKQILMNLLSNAVKYTDSGKIQVSAQISEPKDPEDNYMLQFTVADTGCGISEDKRKSIFDDFARIEARQAPGKEGVGFGLSIVRNLVSLFEGSISVSSNADGGSSFTVCLPVHPSEEKYRPSENPEASFEPSPDSPVVRILVIDDDPSQLHLTAELLRRNGHLTYIADSLPAAWQQLQQHNVDMVFTDIQLIDGSGFDILRLVRGADNLSHLPVVAITANTQYEKQHFIDQGFTAYISKPFVARQLCELIANLGSSIKEQPFNVRQIYDMTEGDIEAISQILHIFASGARTALKAMQQALDLGDYAALKTSAHRILPMCRQLNVSCVSYLACLEQYPIDSPDVAQIQAQNLSVLLQSLPQTLDALESWI